MPVPSQPISRLLAGSLLAASTLAALAGSQAPQLARPAPLLAAPAAPPRPARRAAGANAAAPGTALRVPVFPRRTLSRPAIAAAEAPEGSLLDETGHLARYLPPDDAAVWKAALHRGQAARRQQAWLHLWLGEVELARDEQPEAAIGQFRMVVRLAGISSTKGTKGHEGTAVAAQRRDGCAGLAAYDTAVALFNAGAYGEAAGAFRRLLTAKAAVPGYDGRRCLLWYRRAAACAAYHAGHARLGVPEPPRLDPLCAAAGLAVCLRGLGLPFDRPTIAAACPHTGEGSSAADLLTACRTLGVAGRVVEADDLGLKALPKPLIAHVEGDHFVAVVAAGARGVNYICSDCGCWPGGRVNLTWKQWRALRPGTYVTVTRPGSAPDRALAALPDRPGGQPAPLRLASASLAHLHLWDAPQFSRLLALLKAHVFLTNQVAPAASCGYKQTTMRPPRWVPAPLDGPCAQFSAAAGEPVDLATGEEVYQPDADLAVYNPTGPQVVFQRIYCSLRGPDPGYPACDLGMGWSTNFNAVLADPTAHTNLQVEAGGLGTLIPVTGMHAPSVTPGWDVVENGVVIASSAPQNGHGWTVSGGLDQNNMPYLVVNAPSTASSPTTYEARYNDVNVGNVSGVFDLAGAATVPQGTTLTFNKTGTQPPAANLSWDIQLNGQTMATNVIPAGWSVAGNESGSQISVTAPLLAGMGGTYTARLGQGGPSSGISTTFSVVAERVNYGMGARTLIFPDGSSTPVTANATPQSGTPVQCSLAPGVPLAVEWDYDSNNPSGHYTITFHDGTQWVMTNAVKSTGSAVYYQLSQIVDPRITDHSNPPQPIPLKLVYGPVASGGFPVLSAIENGASNSVLLAINRSCDQYANITSITDAYGRSVFYQVGPVATTGVGDSNWQSYQELEQVSPLVSANMTHPPTRWAYGYENVCNGEGSEQVPFLHTLTVPSPTGRGTSVATINYDASLTDGLTGTVTSTVDADGNQRAYYSFADQTESSPGPGAVTQVVVSNPGNPSLQGFTYSVGYDQYMDLTDVFNAEGIQTYHAAYNDGSNQNRPTSITIGSANDNSARTTTLAWEPPTGSPPQAYGNLASLQTPRGTLTTYQWDHSLFPLGLLTQVQPGSKPATTLSYMGNNAHGGLLASVTTPGPAGSNPPHDPPVTTNFFYSNLGNLTEVDQPPNNLGMTIKTLLGYATPEAVGEPVMIKDGAGDVTHVGYDQRANVVSVIDAMSYETDFLPTIADQLQTVIYPATGQIGSGRGHTDLTYLYPGGPPTLVSETDENGALARQTSLGYGPEGELFSQRGDTETATYQYDAARRLSKLFDGNQAATVYHYTPDGYLSQIIHPKGDLELFGPYDGAGNLLQRQDGNRNITRYQHNDPDGLLSDILYGCDPTKNVHLVYDQYDRRQSMQDGTTGVGASAPLVTYGYGNLDELTSVATQYAGWTAPQTIGYAYYPDGSRQSMQTPAGTSLYQYDLAQRMNYLKSGAGEVSRWGYQPNGWLSTQTLGNGIVSTYTPTQRGDLLSLASAPPGQGNASSFTQIVHDQVGNLLQVNAQIAAVGNYSGLSSFQYDGQDQLKQEKSLRTPNYTEAFGYDLAGNATLYKGAAASYDADNEVSQNPAYGYDGNGNPTFYQNVPLDFDPENHLAQVNQSAPGVLVSHGYNGDGLRAWKQAGTNASSRTYFLFDGSQPVVELNSLGTVIKAVNTFGANGLLSRSTGGPTTFYTFDPQGNVCQRFDSTGTLLSSDEYDAYGALKGQTPGGVGDVFGYGAQYGYYTDPEDSLVLLTNRYYDPGTGRFLNRDPLGQAGGVNQYGYAGNNPSTYADPLGLISAKQGAGLGGAALGAFGGPVGAGLGYLAGTALYDAVNDLGTAVGCNEGGYASTRDVANASVNVAVAAASLLPGEGAAGEVEQASKRVFYHGTDLESAVSFLNGAGLDVGEAAERARGGAPGFYLAGEYGPAEAFGLRAGHAQGTGGLVLKYEMSEAAVGQLQAGGGIMAPIPYGGGLGNPSGSEFFIPPGAFDLFNQLREAGHISITPVQ